ncbi:MAG TPA: glutathione S-transferase N-terminal domain-containing protein, partial [Myxococcota bacterium]|nr:glutathione S-transferase N-terminal domain-containing protein [Myxococcota bacterium]
MIDLYYCPTPNCQKVSIALEELGLPYRVRPIDIVAGDQNDSEYAAICPNRKVP